MDTGTCRKCGKPSGAGVGGFDGWCEEHFADLSRRVVRYVGTQTRDVVFKLAIGEIIKYAAQHFPWRLFSHAGPPPPSVAAEAKLQVQGVMLERWLHASALGAPVTRDLVREAEECWNAIPPEARDAAREWVASAST